ncbi:MAG: hydrogenase maturation nickel metallochaperone HypA [Candidatus Competibacteraceae bacterium]
MHEFSVCQDLLRQVEELAHAHHARAVTTIRLQLGPLSGIEASLLEQAFTVARAGTVAATAVLMTEALPVRVRCRVCDVISEVASNRLVCGSCGDWHTELMSGDELLLASVELELEDNH